MNKKLKTIIPLALAVFIGLTVKTILFQPDFTYVGTLEVTRIDLASRLPSTVGKVSVAEGQKVEQGQLLVELAADDLAIAVRATERDFERASRLRKAGTISEEIFEQIRAKRDETAVRFSWVSIKAPVGGTILDIYREGGEWVSPGMKLLSLANLSEAWATFYVEQPMLAKLSLGMSVIGTLPEIPGREFPGKITRIADEAEFTPKNVQTRAERTRLVYGIKVTFPNGDGVLKPGMSIETQFPRLRSSLL